MSRADAAAAAPVQWLEGLGAAALDQLRALGAGALLASRAAATGVRDVRSRRLRFGKLMESLELAGNRSAGLVILIGGLTGMILALQSAYQLRQLGAMNYVSSLVAISVTRELGPLLTAIIVTGRVGSSIAAEIGSMKVAEEVDALIVIGIDPVSYLVVPRLLALMMAMPALVVLSDLCGILGGALVGATALGLDAGQFVRNALDALVMQDVWGGLLKAFLFGGVIGLVSCQRGLATHGGPEQIGRATTSSVVQSIVWIIALDLVVTGLLYL